MTRSPSHAAAAAAALALALPLALSIAGPAAAQPVAAWEDHAPARVVVAYADAELHSAAGAKAVARRIRIAADRACGGDSTLARTGFGFTACKLGAIRGALADLNAPMVNQALGRAPPPALATR